MASLTETSINRPVAITMFFLIVITLGVIGFRYLPVDLLPPIEFPQLTVSTNYPNVGPQEIETIITEKIENAVASVPGIEKVRSSSSEGRSWVTLEFAQSVDLDVAANDVRAALDRVRGQFPPEVDPPRIFKFDPNDFSIVNVGASSESMNLADLTLLLEREITKRFEQINGVGSIDIMGGINREVKVNLKRDRLIASGLSALQVQQAISRENANLPGGNVSEGIQQLYVRTKGEYENVDQIANTIISTVGNKTIRVKDVADVSFGYQDLNRVVNIDGRPRVSFGIKKQSGANTVKVAEDIRNEVDLINAERGDITLTVTSDQSKFIQDSIDDVQSSAMIGAVLAIFILYIFFRNGSSTFIISIAIPISIIATFGLLYFNGLTLNQMSFGGLALGVGMIVDNAIVVLDNIIRLQEEEGMDMRSSALIGTKQVTGAIIASTLTTIVIFLPVLFMQTISGLLFKQLALVITFSLLCSLVVAMTLVPMLSSRFLRIKKKDGEVDRSKFQQFFTRLENKYSGWVAAAVAHKKQVFGVTLLLVVGSLLLAPTIPVELTPQSDADQIQVDIRMADGTNVTIVNEYLQQMVTIIRSTIPFDDVEHFSTNVRDGSASIDITLIDANKRKSTSSSLAQVIQKQVEGVIPGADVRVTAQSGLWVMRRVFGSGGAEDLQLEVRGFDTETSYEIAQDIKLKLETIEGITGVRIDRSEGTPEQNIVFDREKISQLGLSVNDVARTIQANIGGLRAGMFRIEGDEFPITVRLRPEDRLNSLDLDNISIRTASGAVIPVSSIIEKDLGRGPASISRINGQRYNRITANLDSGLALGEAVKLSQAALADYNLPSGYSIVFSGEYLEQQEAAKDFAMSIIMALVLIYMVMAGQFERFIDPLVVMFSVPFAAIGVVPTLLLTGTTVNIQSLMGMIMLIGIVVNNAIVLVDYINIMRREHDMNVVDAVIESGRLRLRPILMTTLTTALGLIPLSLGIGPGAEIQASLARVVIGGLLASTMVTLIFIPVVYVSVDALKIRVKAWNLNPFKRETEQVELAGS